MAGKDKEAIVICLDVGPAMNQAPPGYCTDLETACDVVSMILQRKLFSESKDEVCLVLFGTPDTANRLSEMGYDNISEVRPMGQVDLNLIQFVKEEVKPSNLSADFLDSMIVAIDIIHSAVNDKASKFTASRVILCSNLGGEFSEDKQQQIIQGFKADGTEINFIGPAWNDEDDGADNNVGNDADHDTPGPSAPRKRPSKVKPRTPQQNSGEAKINSILEEIEGGAFSFRDVIPLLSFFETKPVRQTPWKSNLEIGSKLKIPVCGYIRIKEAAAKSWKSVFKKGGNKEYTPKAVTSFHLNDDEETEVDGEEIVEGFRYGSDVIPITKEDKQNMDYKVPGKVFQVLGFTKQENVKRHQYMGRSVFVFVADPNDDHGAVAFSAVVNAMYETNCVAIVRRGATARSQPKLACLVPHIKAKYESLLFFELPYTEDLRTYTFASITEIPKYQPSDAQLDAVDKLIDSMDLMGEEGGENDEDDEGESELLKPKEMLNPVFQRLYQCLLHRALSSSDDLPEIDPVITESLERPRAVMVNSCKAVDEMKNVFKLEVVKKKEIGTGENVFGVVSQNGDENGTVKQPALNDDANVTMADMAGGTITEVGSVNPVSDFLKLIKNADNTSFINVCHQMQTRIKQLVLESFGSNFYAKAIDSLKCLRTEVLKRKEAGLFNTYMIEFKQKLKSMQKMNFWQTICADKISLISTADCTTSTVSVQEARQFLEDETKVDDVPENISDESADDLLDMME